MVEVECRTQRRDGVTLVAAVVRNDTSVRRRVRVEHTLDGPTWPPRRHGVPAEGWDGAGYVTTVAAGGRAAVGFASPAPAASPSVRVTEHHRVDPEDDDTAASASETAGDVVRRLGDPSPPGDAVPADSGPSISDDRREGESAGRDEYDDSELPPPVAEWFRAVAAHLETAENCADATTLREATRAVEDAGSLDDVEATVDRLEADAAALRAAERRAGTLADRARRAADSVPVATLRALS
jgi:outer membrane murein-binding lipoprotein Lpp